MALKVLMTSTKYRGCEDQAAALLKGRGLELVPFEIKRTPDEETLAGLVDGISGLIAGPEPVTGRVLAAAPSLKVVNAPGVGYDHIDVAAATARGVAVCICAGANHHAVAEMTLGMIISLARHIGQAERALRAGRWGGARGVELWGKTLGIVGLGNIGKRLALMAVNGMGMRVLAADTYRDVTFASEHNLTYVPLPRLMAESDFVSLHCPLTPATRRLINTETLALMKPSAFLVNTARGALVDEPALLDALRSGRIAGAALDVFAVEPCVPNPFAELENVLVLPHIAGITAEAVQASLEVAVENIATVLEGGRPAGRIN